MSLHIAESIGGAVEFDVRSWSVRTLVDNATAGTVHEMLTDENGAPRYIDVALGTAAKHVLVPIGLARADRIHKLVWVPGFAIHQFDLIPSYQHAPLSRGDEARLLSAYSATMAGAMPRRGYRVLSSAPQRKLAPRDPNRLVELSSQGSFRVASGDADPRGWTVTTRDGVAVGAVRDLLLDSTAMKVRYLVAEVEVDGVPPRRVLIPVEFVRLDGGASAVMLSGFSPALLGSLEPFDGGPPDPAAESQILERFAEAQEGEEFYLQPRFDARAFFA